MKSDSDFTNERKLYTEAAFIKHEFENKMLIFNVRSTKILIIHAIIHFKEDITGHKIQLFLLSYKLKFLAQKFHLRKMSAGDGKVIRYLTSLLDPNRSTPVTGAIPTDNIPSRSHSTP